MPRRQGPLTARRGLAQQRLRVSDPPHGVVQVRQPGQASQRVGVVGTQHPTGIRAAPLGVLHRGRHPARRLIRGGQAGSGRDRGRVTAAQHLLAVGQHPLVLRDGVLDPAVGQAGRGEPFAGGDGQRVAWPRQPLAVGQAARQQPARRRVVARGLVGGGQLVPGAEGLRVPVAADLLVLADSAEHDGHRVRGLAGHDQGPGQTDASGHDRRVPGRQLTGPVGQHALVPLDGLRRVPGGQVRGGQPIGYHQRVRVAGGQLGVAARGQVLPELDGRAGQAGLVQAPADPQQQRMKPVGPQRIQGRVLQAARVRPQAGRRPRRRLVGGPHLEQRSRGRPGRGLLDLGGRG